MDCFQRILSVSEIWKFFNFAKHIQITSQKIHESLRIFLLCKRHSNIFVKVFWITSNHFAVTRHTLKNLEFLYYRSLLLFFSKTFECFPFHEKWFEYIRKSFVNHFEFAVTRHNLKKSWISIYYNVSKNFTNHFESFLPCKRHSNIFVKLFWITSKHFAVKRQNLKKILNFYTIDHF